MIIASIALEERALGRVIDSEADKLQYVLDNCRENCPCDGTPEEILEVNRSVTRLLDVVARNQMILHSKLALAMGADCKCPPEPPCPPQCPPPCPSPCPPCPSPEPPCHPKPTCDPFCQVPPQKSFIRLGLSDSRFLWKNGCPMPWKRLSGHGSAVRWSSEDPSLVELDPGRPYSFNCTFIIRDFPPPTVPLRICLESAGTPQKELPLYFSVHCDADAIILQSAMLMPGSASALSLRLNSETPLCVEHAEMTIKEL